MGSLRRERVLLRIPDSRGRSGTSEGGGDGEPETWRERLERLTGIAPTPGPVCKIGRLVYLERLPPQVGRPPAADPAVSGMALACGARIVYTSPTEPRGYYRPRRSSTEMIAKRRRSNKPQRGFMTKPRVSAQRATLGRGAATIPTPTGLYIQEFDETICMESTGPGSHL